MLKRLYVHNYKCLVNFEINFDQDISLFLGANGSGKSTVFEVLAKLRRVIVGEEKVTNVFDYTDTPRWLGYNPVEKTEVSFELDIEINKLIFKYLLIIEFVNWTKEVSVKEESLMLDGDIYIQSKGEKTVSFVSNNEEYSFDNSRSSIGRHFPSKKFLNYLRSLFIVRIKPYEMLSTIYKANSEVQTDFSNFSEWFAHLNEKYRREISVFENVMRDILPRFDIFHIEQAGQVKVLQVDFEDSNDKKKIVTYYFNELSDGQKILIALYALIYCVPENSMICIDEPENFLALPEIQPWLNELRDKCKERNLQALLVSHHPSLINFLAPDSGYWFSRQENNTAFEKITEQEEDGLSLAQLIEMGWIYGD
jgi:predicted ATPase